MPKGILVDYEWCSGCHACEMACQVEHELPHEQYGVKLADVGPYNIEGDNWVWIHMPIFTDQCDLCEKRVAKGKLPSCVQHCQAAIMKYGDLDELGEALASKPKQILFSLGK